MQSSNIHDNIFIIEMFKVDELKQVGMTIFLNVFIRSVIRKVTIVTQHTT
jgi:hypothetical protein